MPFMGWMWGMAVLWLLFVAGVGWALWSWFAAGRRQGAAGGEDDPLAILQIRLARGEITPEEYTTMRDLILRDRRPRGGP